jgi:uncharacterized protein DUF5979
MVPTQFRRLGYSVGALALAVSVACVDSPISPTSTPNTGVLGSVSAAVAQGELEICKVTVGGDDSFVFNWSIAGGASGQVTLSNGQCQTVASGVTIRSQATVTEAAPPANWAVTNIVVLNQNGIAGGTVDIPNRTATRNISNDAGASFTFTNTFTPPATGCTFTQGYWKTHPADWPVTTLTLGTVTYTQAQLLAILGQEVNGNGLISLAKQLIAAKLNVADGADPTAVSAAIAAADALIGGLVVPPVGSGFLAPSTTDATKTTLANYNQGLTGPGHCP